MPLEDQMWQLVKEAFEHLCSCNAQVLGNQLPVSTIERFTLN